MRRVARPETPKVMSGAIRNVAAHPDPEPAYAAVLCDVSIDIRIEGVNPNADRFPRHVTPQYIPGRSRL